MGGVCCGKFRSHSSEGVGENGELVAFDSSHSLNSTTSTVREQRKERIRRRNMNSHLVHHVVDKADFAKELKEAGNKLVVVDFYAQWCGPCKEISPKVEVMASQMTDVVFLKVDVDDCDDVAQEYGISCMPTFIFFKKGAKLGEFSGANADKLAEHIQDYRK